MQLSLYLFLLVLLLVVLKLALTHLKLLNSIEFYRKQGITIMPGADRPLIGNLLEYSAYDEEAKNHDGPMPNYHDVIRKRFIKDDYKDDKATFINIFGNDILFIHDAEMVQDIF